MGYSTYYQMNSSLTAEEFKQIQTDFIIMKRKSLITVKPEKNCGWETFFIHESDKTPSVENMAICFNGEGADSHETFILMNNDRSNFCKTAHKPYDTLVSGLLLWMVFKHPTYIDVRSDGDVEDWEPALQLMRDTFALDFKIRFDSNGYLVIDKAIVCEDLCERILRGEFERGSFS